MEYTEPELIIPALKIIKAGGKAGVSTSVLIKRLTQELKPTGNDAKILDNRKDTHFSQKVRNLKSHNTLTGRGLATYANRTWNITEFGEVFVTENEPVLEALHEQGFSKESIEKEIEANFEGIIIEEGASKTITTTQRERSTRLRDLKIRQIKAENGGRLECCACGFDFEKKYNGLGKDFMHIHHTQAIHTMDIQGTRQTAEEALKKVVPLCSNCHNMVHRNRIKMLTIEELKEIIKKQDNLN